MTREKNKKFVLFIENCYPNYLGVLGFLSSRNNSDNTAYPTGTETDNGTLVVSSTNRAGATQQ